MRKTICLLFAFVACLPIHSQKQGGNDVFDHLSVGITAGTEGAGLQLATTVGPNFQLRAGYAFMPHFPINYDMNVAEHRGLMIEGHPELSNFDVLVDFYPFRSGVFRLTAGAYIGSARTMKVTDAETMPTPWQAVNDRGYMVGDYFVECEPSQLTESVVKTHAFKPYVGLGLGRAVAKDGIFSFMIDAGVMFWGKPKVYGIDPHTGNEIAAQKAEDLNDDGGLIATFSKLPIYPVLSFRVGIKLF